MFIIAKAMKSFKKFRFVDLVIFESYIFVAGLFFGTLFPILTTLNMRYYLVFAILGTIYLCIKIFRKNTKKLGFFDGITEHLNNLSFWEIGVYKLTIFVFALFILKVIPILFEIHIAIYSALFAFGIGYFVSKIFSK